MIADAVASLAFVVGFGLLLIGVGWIVERLDRGG